MKKVLTLIAAVMLLMLSACGRKTETKYLQTSVTQEHFGNVTFRSEMEYNAEGRMTTMIQYVDGEEATRTSYSYTENTVIMEITQDGESGTMKQVYEKDDAGNVIHAETYMDDELYYITDSTFDDKGNMLTSVQQTVSIGATYTTTNEYDEKGNRIKMTFDYGNGAGAVNEMTYDNEGNLLTSTAYDLQGNVTSREEHTWDETGAERIRVCDADGNLTATTFVTYDEAGNMLTSETFDASGALTLRITYTYEAFEIPVK